MYNKNASARAVARAASRPERGTPAQQSASADPPASVSAAALAEAADTILSQVQDGLSESIIEKITDLTPVISGLVDNALSDALAATSLSGVDAGLASLESAFSTLQQDIAELKSQIATLKQDVSAIAPRKRANRSSKNTPEPDL